MNTVIRRTHAIAMMALVALGCTSVPGNGSVAQADNTTARTALPHPAINQVRHDGSTVASLADVAERAVHAVVNVSSTRVLPREQSPFFGDPFFRYFFPFGSPQIPSDQRSKSLGSGVLVDNGVVVTNNHVIDGAESIRITFSDNQEHDVEIAGRDPKTDLAVLRVKGGTPGRKPLPIGDSTELRLGDVVVAVGNPFGVGHSVTMGIVSATGRANVGVADYEDFIQTDAAINPGNSGGALVNMKGELVGINTAILSRTGGYQGIGFAIPSAMVKGVIDSLLEEGTVKRGWLGVSIQDIDNDLQKALTLPSARGVLVSEVLDGGPAQRAGLKQRDVILEIDGKVASSAASLRNIVASKRPGQRIALLVVRDGKRQHLHVELGTMPVERAVAGRESGGTLDGLTLSPLDAATRERHAIDASVERGVVVTQVEPGSLPAEAGVLAGDVILAIGGKQVASVAEAEKLYAANSGHVLFLIKRRQQALFVAWSKPKS